MVGDGFHLRQWDSHRHAEFNAESLSEYEHDQWLSDKPTVKCDSRIGRQAASKRCDAIWRVDHQARLRLENGSGRGGLSLGDFVQGEQVVEAQPLASGSVAVWMSIRSRGFARLQVSKNVLLSFAVDVIATSQFCDTASKKRETNTSCREQEPSIRQEALHLTETNKCCFVETLVGGTEGSTVLER